MWPVCVRIHMNCATTLPAYHWLRMISKKLKRNWSKQKVLNLVIKDGLFTMGREYEWEGGGGGRAGCVHCILSTSDSMFVVDINWGRYRTILQPGWTSTITVIPSMPPRPYLPLHQYLDLHPPHSTPLPTFLILPFLLSSPLTPQPNESLAFPIKGLQIVTPIFLQRSICCTTLPSLWFSTQCFPFTLALWFTVDIVFLVELVHVEICN